MKSVKNHLSLIVALVSILFSIQIFTIVDRSIEAYKSNLAKNYSMIVVSQKKLDDKKIIKREPLIKKFEVIESDNVIKRFNKDINKKNLELLKIMLPKFYKVHLKRYPSPKEVKELKKVLFQNKSVIKIEDYSRSHDTIYKLLVLFKNVVFVFAFVVSIVTMLLIAKELRIWQFKHNERMSIMGLFGAPTWLRSAILFRLAIVDALISSFVTLVIFLYISSNRWVLEQFKNLNIDVVIFNVGHDFLVLISTALILSVLLASLIVVGHKEEV